MDIFKIYWLNSNGDPYKIYIFGCKEEDNLFSKDELDLFKTQNIKPEYFSKRYIYNDDNINNIKRKIFIHINTTNPALLDNSSERELLTNKGWEVSFDTMEIEI